MFIKKNVLSVIIFCAFNLISIVTLSKTASANIWPSAGSLGITKSDCSPGSEQHQEIIQLKKEIAAAGTVNQARKIALAPTDGAIDALKNARIIMPLSDDLRLAESWLNDARSRILVASSQEQVADEFSGMMLAGLDNDSAAHVSVGKASCNYSTGETIAIVLGLILGIIPGLILLVVLC
jgi:hypothetical protein